MEPLLQSSTTFEISKQARPPSSADPQSTGDTYKHAQNKCKLRVANKLTKIQRENRVQFLHSASAPFYKQIQTFFSNTNHDSPTQVQKNINSISKRDSINETNACVEWVNDKSRNETFEDRKIESLVHACRISQPLSPSHIISPRRQDAVSTATLNISRRFATTSAIQESLPEAMRPPCRLARFTAPDGTTTSILNDL
ncbi:hypothetical protein Tcan_00100 [Toxocara canis]|uniref:Uncharacterized protein n=1 Tax=Toxocara canis TaxID=6265 RepID=A0A0B2US64_TOXCA|nr:hypothetical protein Tcan_00100 [Toxocara canis]